MGRMGWIGIGYLLGPTLRAPYGANKKWVPQKDMSFTTRPHSSPIMFEDSLADKEIIHSCNIKILKQIESKL